MIVGMKVSMLVLCHTFDFLQFHVRLAYRVRSSSCNGAIEALPDQSSVLPKHNLCSGGTWWLLEEAHSHYMMALETIAVRQLHS